MGYWFFHAVEQDGGRWRCQHGRTIFDEHDDEASAVAHLRQLAQSESAWIVVHFLDGLIKRIPHLLPEEATDP